MNYYNLLERTKTELKRYHKELFFPEQDLKALNCLIERLNSLRYTFTSHSLEKIKDRLEIDSIGYFLKDLKLEYSNLFEYYKEEGIIKLCFRVKFDNERDLILVLSYNKVIITVYLNNNKDNHRTLNPKNYCMAS